MKLYGSVTSPYVRRVRILALEQGIPFTLCNTMEEAGQAELRARSPIWKVPAAEWEGQFIVDSHVILDELLRRANGPFSPSFSLPPAERNRLNYVDTCLDSLVQRFYLFREGVSLELPWMTKQLARAESAFSHLEQTLSDADSELSLFSLSLATTLTWCKFRNTYPIERHPKLLALTRHCEERPSFVKTYPE